MALTIIITGSILGYLAIGAVMAYLAGLFDQADTSTLFWITWAWPAFVFVAAVYVVCIPAMLAMALGQAMRRARKGGHSDHRGGAKTSRHAGTGQLAVIRADK